MSEEIPRSTLAIVFTPGGILMHIGIICNIIVIYKTIAKWKKLGNWPMPLKFPFYLAITDIVLYISSMVDQLHVLIYQRSWDGEMCKLSGVFFGFAALLNMMTVLAVTLHTYLQIVWGWNYDLGRFDWKLIAFVFAVSLCSAIIEYPNAGPSRFWCYEE
ncbi:hypothetical protein HDV04_001963 [Boothiomyces sp. JEL0838]|nr:hypothetical protein HDV04_001963 [Boothiomyces sp. JEL0838]